MKPSSLRARLTLIILPPLLIISLIAGAWQFHNTTLRAESIFDKGLLSAAIAISRDVALSDGDAISPSTRRLLADTSGGTIFYHVFAPDGVFVTGYSTPPVLPSMAPKGVTDPFYYNSVYQGENVRVLRFQDVTLVSGIAGIFNITVWQNASVRSSFVRNVLSRSFAVIAALVMSVAIVVWFGVRLGRISSKDEFISNAAHQLRNPMAGVLALAEAVTTAPNPQTAQKRSAELLQAAREASDLTNKLLSFERASGTDVSQTGRPMDLNQLIAHAVSTFEQNHPKASLTVTQDLPRESLFIQADQTMLQEAVLNIFSNCLVHGGPKLKRIWVTLRKSGAGAEILIQDDGIGIPEDRHIEALSRFSQAGGGPGSGLGLAIAARVMKNHGGQLSILPSPRGAKIKLSFSLLDI